MRIYVDIDSSRVIQSPGTISSPSLLEFKRGASSSIEVIFYSELNQYNHPDSVTGEFGLKELGKYDGDLVVADSGWSMVETDGKRSYFFAPNFNTTELNALLGHDGAGGDTSDDLDYVDLMLEISWSQGGQIGKTNTITARVYNDVLKGGEGVPVSGTPAYPGAQTLLDLIDRDWKAVAMNSVLDTAAPSTWDFGAISYMQVWDYAAYPEQRGQLITDCRVEHATAYGDIVQYFKSYQGTKLYRRSGLAGDTWGAWVEDLALSSGSINEDVTLAGVTKATGNDLSDEDHIPSIGQLDAAAHVNFWRTQEFPGMEYQTSGAGNVSDTTYGGGASRVKLGGSTAGYAQMSFGRGLTSYTSASGSGVDFYKQFSIAGQLACELTNDSSKMRLIIGADDTQGPLADVTPLTGRAICLEIYHNGTNVVSRLLAHDGTTLTTGAEVVIAGYTAQSLLTFRIEFVPGGTTSLYLSVGSSQSATKPVLHNSVGGSPNGVSAYAYDSVVAGVYSDTAVASNSNLLIYPLTLIRST